MKKLLAILLLTSPAYAGVITHTDYTAGSVITAAGQNTNENAIVNEINGNLDAANIEDGSIGNAEISVSAGITYSKLSLTGGILNADVNSAAAIATSKLASGTTSQVIVSSGAFGMVPTFAYFGVIQTTQCWTTTSSATATTQFAATGLSCKITPKSANSYIEARISGTSNMSADNINYNYTLYRSSTGFTTNLGPANGFTGTFFASGSGVTPARLQVAFNHIDIDSHAAGTELTYTVMFKVDGAATVTFPTSASERAVLILQEIQN